MLKRFKQFYRAVTADRNGIDHNFIDRWLSQSEKQLFEEYAVYDQIHVLNVARTVEELVNGESSTDWSLLMRASLLHDIGRTKKDMTIAGKVFAVLAHKLAPVLKRQAREDWKRRSLSWRHVLYIYYNHPQLSREKLEAIGAESALLDLVSNHHKPIQAGDSVEMRLLKMGDALN